MHWVFLAMRGLSLVAVSRGYSSLRCTGFSLQWLLLLQSMGSRHVGFSSCGTWAQLLRSMWDLPRPGLKPVSPAMAGRFLTTAPPGKSPPPAPEFLTLLLIYTHLPAISQLLLVTGFPGYSRLAAYSCDSLNQLVFPVLGWQLAFVTSTL